MVVAHALLFLDLQYEFTAIACPLMLCYTIITISFTFNFRMRSLSTTILRCHNLREVYLLNHGYLMEHHLAYSREKEDTCI